MITKVAHIARNGKTVRAYVILYRNLIEREYVDFGIILKCFFKKIGSEYLK
jgi:hypothetical protein